MGRPKSSIPSSSINVRVTAEVRALADAKANELGIDKSKLVHRLIKRATGHIVSTPDEIKAWEQIRDQLNGLGNNLNQIAHSAKTGAVVWTDDDRADVHALKEEIKTLKSDWVKWIAACRLHREPTSQISKLLKSEGLDQGLSRVAPGESEL